MIFSKPECLTMLLDAADGTDPALACSIIHALSQWQPNTTNVAGSEKDSETWGLFQFTSQQARQSGYKGDLPQLLEVGLNIQIGLDLLRNSLTIANNYADKALLLYLGRSRVMLIPGIMSLIPLYEKLIAARPENHETKVACDIFGAGLRPN